MKKKLFGYSLPLFSALISMLLTASTSTSNPDAIVGTWLTGSKKGHVQIYKQGNEYYGKITWLKEPNDPATRQPRSDSNNPDPRRKNQPLIGLVNLRSFEYEGENLWDNGRIYDPENGKEYSCKMTLRNPNTLDVRGYIGVSLIGRTDTWVRVK